VAFRYDAIHIRARGAQMRQFVLVSSLVMAAMLVSAQTKKTTNPATKSTPRTAALPSPTPAATPTKVSGPPRKTPSGVQYWDISVGTGPEAMKGQTVSILFVGWLENGKEFKASDDPDVPMELTIGNGRQIKGWDEGVTGMRVGGKRQLRIPPSAAYGEKGAPPLVPPNATLIMDVQLLGVKPGPKAAVKTRVKK